MAFIEIDKIMRVYNTEGAGLYYRSGPGLSNSPLGISREGEEFKCTKEENNWYFIESKNGWSSGQYLQLIKDNAENVTQEVTKEENQEVAEIDEEEQRKQIEAEEREKQQLAIEEQEKVYTEYLNKTYNDATSASFDNILKTNLSGIYGIPYQFPDSVDRKLPGSEFGYYYTDRILTKMPLLMMSPGKVSFMSEFKKEDKLPVVESLINAAGDTITDLTNFLSKSGKYYSFEYATEQYWKYVNGMNRACAIYLGIENVKVNINGYEQNLKDFRWENACTKNQDTWIVSEEAYVCFYTDATSTKNEDFSNSTTESQLSQKVNSFSDLAKEVQFLMGAGFGATVQALQEDNIGNLQAQMDEVINKYLNGSQMFKDLTRDFSIVATGGKLIFPEIWSDSEFSQSFDVNIKLRCPCPNLLQWYLDICVPLNHLIAFTLPKTPDASESLGANYHDTGNGYCTPFLVRAFYKGLFNCDMGIVTSLSVSKGKEGSWSIDGLPSEVDVSMTIKDLYNVMAMTNPDNTADFMNNTTMMNYLANSCGISINKPDIERAIDTFVMLKGNALKDKFTFYNRWKRYQNTSVNLYYNIYKGIFGGA